MIYFLIVLIALYICITRYCAAEKAVAKQAEQRMAMAALRGAAEAAAKVANPAFQMLPDGNRKILHGALAGHVFDPKGYVVSRPVLHPLLIQYPSVRDLKLKHPAVFYDPFAERKTLFEEAAIEVWCTPAVRRREVYDAKIRQGFYS